MENLTDWDKAKETLKQRVDANIFEAWLSALKPSQISPPNIIFEVPDAFFKEWISENYLGMIKEAFKQACGFDAQIELQINPALYATQDRTRLDQYATTRTQEQTPGVEGLNSRYTLDSFVIGNSNRFAHAACLAVTEAPAKTYNPLFIYGKVGLGKTHLIQGICQSIRLKYGGQFKICYIPSEKFTNELIDAIRHGRTNQFRQKYRSVDVLVIDDIHFIAGKESTQEEFFHTFNTLYDSHKQIIISSDRNPKAISHLEERLVSRFAWGLITDVQPPDFELRVAILKKKVEREPVNISDDVITFIAQTVTANIRELEGALVKVIAHSLLEEKPITLALAHEALKDVLHESQKTISVETIQRTVANIYDVSVNDLRAGKRQKSIVQARQIAMYLSRELTGYSLPEIGEYFGGKDHTTVLYSCSKIKKEMAHNSSLKKKIDAIMQEIKQ